MTYRHINKTPGLKKTENIIILEKIFPKQKIKKTPAFKQCEDALVQKDV